MNGDLMGRHVIARFTASAEVYGRGRVIGYSDVASYTIESANGNRFSWRANMTEVDEDAERVEALARVADHVDPTSAEVGWGAAPVVVKRNHDRLKGRCIVGLVAGITVLGAIGLTNVVLWVLS